MGPYFVQSVEIVFAYPMIFGSKKMKIRLYLETDEHGREYFKHTREAAAQLVKDAIAATEKDGIIRRVGYEVSKNDS